MAEAACACLREGPAECNDFQQQRLRAWWPVMTPLARAPGVETSRLSADWADSRGRDSTRREKSGREDLDPTAPRHRDAGRRE